MLVNCKPRHAEAHGNNSLVFPVFMVLHLLLYLSFERVEVKKKVSVATIQVGLLSFRNKKSMSRAVFKPHNIQILWI